METFVADTVVEDCPFGKRCQLLYRSHLASLSVSVSVKKQDMTQIKYLRKLLCKLKQVSLKILEIDQNNLVISLLHCKEIWSQ